MRTFIVGDVHGCLEELDRLLEKVDFRAGRDRLVSVGDLVAKGPDGPGVLRRARELGAAVVRGNHEDRVLRFAAGREPRRAGSEHQRLAETLSADDLAFLEAMPLYIDLPDDGVLVVHAGLDPRKPLEAQSPEVLMNVRSIRPDGTPSPRVEDGVPWASRYRGRRLVVYGHDAIRGLQLRERSVGLDSGCVYGGELSALELPARRLHSVSASAVHCQPTARRALVKLPVCREDELAVGESRVVQIGVSPAGIPEQAIVLRDGRGEVRAYKNTCKHLPIPLDSGAGAVPRERGHLVCVTHGARYRESDGYCVEGPCAGHWLDPIRVRVEGDALVLHLRG